MINVKQIQAKYFSRYLEIYLIRYRNDNVNRILTLYSSTLHDRTGIYRAVPGIYDLGNGLDCDYKRYGNMVRYRMDRHPGEDRQIRIERESWRVWKNNHFILI